MRACQNHVRVKVLLNFGFETLVYTCEKTSPFVLRSTLAPLNTSPEAWKTFVALGLLLNRQHNDYYCFCCGGGGGGGMSFLSFCSIRFQLNLLPYQGHFSSAYKQNLCCKRLAVSICMQNNTKEIHVYNTVLLMLFC